MLKLVFLVFEFNFALGFVFVNVDFAYKLEPNVEVLIMIQFSV